MTQNVRANLIYCINNSHVFT